MVEEESQFIQKRERERVGVLSNWECDDKKIRYKYDTVKEMEQIRFDTTQRVIAIIESVVKKGHQKILVLYNKRYWINIIQWMENNNNNNSKT